MNEMNVHLSTLANELDTTDRTLRRAVDQGLLRAHRPSPRKLEMSVKERAFLRRSWPLLSRLREAFRTEPAVSFAVLFGSRARGDAHSSSDVDVLVELREGADVRTLASRLSERLELRVQMVTLEEAEKTPLLLAEILREGRVLVDREALWPRLNKRAPSIQKAAHRERLRVEREFATSFA